MISIAVNNADQLVNKEKKQDYAAQIYEIFGSTILQIILHVLEGEKLPQSLIILQDLMEETIEFYILKISKYASDAKA